MDYLCHDIMNTQHDRPSQMNSNDMLYQIDSLSLFNLPLLSIELSFICEGQWRSIRITFPGTRFKAGGSLQHFEM